MKIECSRQTWAGQTDKVTPYFLQKRLKLANVLLLGTGEAGKSTFVKQMKIIYGGGFTDEDKTRFRDELVTNVVDSFVTLSREMMKLGIAYKVSGVSCI